MMCGNMKFILSVDKDISRLRKANEWDMQLNTRNNFIFPSIHVLFCLLYKTIVLLPDKNTAVNSNAFYDIDTCEIIMNNNYTCKIIDFINGGKINKPLFFI